MKTVNRYRLALSKSVMLVGAVLFAVCTSGEAQQPGKIFRIGRLDVSTASGSAILCEAFRNELGKLAWIDGKNIHIESRFAEQKLTVCLN